MRFLANCPCSSLWIVFKMTYFLIPNAIFFSIRCGYAHCLVEEGGYFLFYGFLGSAFLIEMLLLFASFLEYFHSLCYSQLNDDTAKHVENSCSNIAFEIEWIHVCKPKRTNFFLFNLIIHNLVRFRGWSTKTHLKSLISRV